MQTSLTQPYYLVAFYTHKRHGSDICSRFDSHAENRGSSLGEKRHISATRFQPHVDMLANQKHIHLIPCLSGVECKIIVVIEMEDVFLSSSS